MRESKIPATSCNLCGKPMRGCSGAVYTCTTGGPVFAETMRCIPCLDYVIDLLETHGSTPENTPNYYEVYLG